MKTKNQTQTPIWCSRAVLGDNENGVHGWRLAGFFCFVRIDPTRPRRGRDTALTRPARAGTDARHAHARTPPLLELTHGPKQVPAPSQPNGCRGRVHLPAPPPQGNPHPPFSADKEGPRRPPRGEVPSPGGLGLPGSHAML